MHGVDLRARGFCASPRASKFVGTSKGCLRLKSNTLSSRVWHTYKKPLRLPWCLHGSLRGGAVILALGPPRKLGSWLLLGLSLGLETDRLALSVYQRERRSHFHRYLLKTCSDTIRYDHGIEIDKASHLMLLLAHFTSLTVDYGTAHSLEDMWYSVTPEPIAKEQARKACSIGHSWVARFRGVLSRVLECSSL